MNENLINVCYESASGSIDIRTCYIEGILHFSLKDIFIVLNKENKELGEKNPTRFIPNLIKNQINDLELDEYRNVPVKDGAYEDEKEIFVTQPGLNRVMGNDKSMAGRKFQRWLYHEVVPSLTKHGTYPAPQTPQGSALTRMAEVVAQNAIAIADIFRQQDELVQKMDDVSTRLAKLEDGNEDEHILTVKQWFERAETALSEKKEYEIVVWCENLSITKNSPMKKCASGERMRTKFYSAIILEAKELVEQYRG
ncbi:BRO family protein [Serratia marcescens]|uniref:hypothetical protein n=1 Tax=Serratia marcescens TaxID=615 RepID=UPI003204A8AE